ncbi:MAG: CinA family nicotinamide mononucleotide deamidase-related protein, partial [Robiginitalea sp.]|nr:CinA family nicotinamide mononucleotide deamidase-related protein [Robiginitalea sp.]
MLAEIITIGDEILIGQVVDTNSAYLASELHKIGVAVYQITSVQDQRDHILMALEEAEARADIVLLTGGLGPTKDDITKHTLCEYFGDHLVADPKVLAHIEHLFKTYISTPISDLNRRQAEVPSRATVLHNAYGTAPGMWLRGKKAVFVSMPGVPFEMKQLFQDQVRPRIVAAFTRPVLLHRTLITYGLGESAIAERLTDWEEALPPHMKLAYLPNLGKVRLRVSIKGTDLHGLEDELEAQVRALKTHISDILFGEEDGEPLEETLQKLFTAKKATLATAESFTGGKIAAGLTAIPGASAYFQGSVVSYATDVKTGLLQVPEELVSAHSV